MSDTSEAGAVMAVALIPWVERGKEGRQDGHQTL